jgi:hypothetical protein
MKLAGRLLGVVIFLTGVVAIASLTVGPGGLYIEDDVPGTTTNRLYNDGGTLMWDGAEVGSGTCGITYTATPKYEHIGDYSNVIQDAIDTNKPVYIPAGTYTLTAPLVIDEPGQIVCGAGIGRTILYVPNSAWAKTGNKGIIELEGSEPGPVVRDLSIRFTQPDEATRGNLNQFLPAIYFGADDASGGLPRCKIQNIEILGALIGIELAGSVGGDNSGGTFIDNVRLCTFQYGIHADWLLDNTRFTHIDVGNYGTYDDPTALTNNQKTVFRASDTYAIYIDRQDGLHISNSKFEDIGVGVRIGDGSSAVQSMISNSSFININHQALYAVNSASIFGVSDCLFSFDSTTSSSTAIYSGSSSDLMFSSCEFSLTDKQGRLIDASGLGLTVSNCRFDIDSDVDTTGFIQVGATCEACVSNNVVEFSASTTDTSFIHGVSGSGFTLMNNRFIPADGATGRDAYTTAAADTHIIIGNYFNGWTASGSANQKADNIS